MYMSSDGGKNVVKITADGIEFSTDNGETWKSVGYQSDDTIDCMRYTNEILDDMSAIYKINKQIQSVKQAFDSLEGEDCCEYCRYKDECHGMTSNGRGEPVYPACANMDVEEYLDYEAFKEEYLEYEKFKRYYLGKFKEEKIMDILEIYANRTFNSIEDEYFKKRDELLNSNEIIARYNEINNTYKAAMDEFVNEEKVKASGLIIPTAYLDTASYEINKCKVDELCRDLDLERENKTEALHSRTAEVRAMIDIVPKDGNYDTKVIEILKNYEILDKKGKINA